MCRSGTSQALKFSELRPNPLNSSIEVMKKQSIRFIANPISGASKPIDWQTLIDEYVDPKKIDYELTYTKGRGDATNLAREAVESEIDIVCAIGGDGTINETAQGLLNSETALAIIPRGSGNGLARHLGIPLDPIHALTFLHDRSTHKIDVGFLNDRLFLCAAGVGFDATVAHAFDQFGKRGLLSYLYLAFKTYLKYRPITYQITFADKSIAVPALFIAFANASQYGNNAYVAPHADVTDGMLDLAIIRPFPFWHSLGIVLRTFNRTLHRSSFVKSYRFDELRIDSLEQLAHVDGEPLMSNQKIKVSIQPKALKILY